MIFCDFEAPQLKLDIAFINNPPEVICLFIAEGYILFEITFEF